MKAVLLESPGAPEAFKYTELPTPRLKRANDVLIRLHAAGVNPIDTKIRANALRFPLTLPAILGCDGAGVIEAVGPDVMKFSPGDRVYFSQVGFGNRQGTYAQYAVVDADLVARMPDSLDFPSAAAAPLVLITAWEALFDRMSVCPGSSILIHAGAGGVGHVAIQLASNAGAKVCTTVSSSEKASFVKECGAEHVVNYKKDNLVESVMEWSKGRGVDAVLDTVGGPVFQASFALIRSYGDIATLLQPPSDTDWSEARKRNLRVSLELMLSPSPAMLDLPDARKHQGDILHYCAEQFDTGMLNIRVARTFALKEAAQAHQYLESIHPLGKVVLDTT